jgi:hypothetical protein
VEITRLVARALRLVKDELSSVIAHNATPSDGTVGAIVSLLIHANMLGLGYSSAVHIRGLQQVLAYRHGAGPAGFARLRRGNAYLAQKIRRADLDLAVRSGSRPLFAVAQDGPERRARAAVLSFWDCGGCVLPAVWRHADPQLQTAARTVRALCRIAAAGIPSAAKLEPMQFQDVFLCGMYQLLEFAPLASPRPTEFLDSALQLGLLAFLTTLLDRHGAIQAFHVDLLAKLMEHEIRRTNPGDLCHTGLGAEMALWLAFMYGLVKSNCIMADTTEIAWLLETVRSLASELDYMTWENTREALLRFAWVPTMHDARGQRLWDLSMTTVSRSLEGMTIEPNVNSSEAKH